MFNLSVFDRLKLWQTFLILSLIGLVLASIPSNLYMKEAGKALSAYAQEQAGLPAVAKLLNNEGSRKIVDIVAVIAGIAFQTNILALNAAVEAARTGEQGRGFAVVAAEVRNLTQRSASAAKEIKDLINHRVEKVEAGNLLADQAGVAMGEIQNRVRRITPIKSKIAVASAEQGAGIEQINHAVTQLDNMTQQNTALVEQTVAVSSSLQEQAAALVTLMSIFTLADQVAAAARSASPHMASQRRIGVEDWERS